MTSHLYRRVLRSCAFALILLGSTACSPDQPANEAFIESADVGATVATDDGGLIYGDATGQIWAVDGEGNRGSSPLANLPVEPDGLPKVRGLARSESQVFVSFVDAESTLDVSRIENGIAVPIWGGPRISSAEYAGGAISITAGGRVILATGTFDSSEASGSELSGKILTLDPDMPASQRPNVVASGFENPTALTYDQGGSLWVADSALDGTGIISRVGNTGDKGTPTRFDGARTITAMTSYSEQELAFCQSNSNELQRLFIDKATSAVPGRVLAEDCEGSLIQLNDERLAYSNGSALRVIG